MRKIRKSKNRTKFLGIALAMIGSMIIVRIIPLAVWYALLCIMVVALILIFYWGMHG
ncbi:MAG: hypothetical protein VB095_03105 [Anaerovorax sp.]|nr:hypothetical protein [Anaerovorax sp.]